MHISRRHYDALTHLAASNIKVSDILLSLLWVNKGEHTPLTLQAVNDFSSNIRPILDAFESHAVLGPETNQWMHTCVYEDLSDEVQELSTKKTGWHGYARSAGMNDFQSIDASAMASTAKNVAPHLWSLFEHLMLGNAGSDSEEEDNSNLAMEIQGNQVHGTLREDRACRLRDLVRQLL